MKAKMAFFRSKTRNHPKKWAMAGVFFLLPSLLFLPHPAYSGTTPSPKSDVDESSAKVVERINKAIKEAEKKLGANPVVEEVRKDLKTNLTPVPKKRQPAPVKKVAPAKKPAPVKAASQPARPARPIVVKKEAPKTDSVVLKPSDPAAVPSAIPFKSVNAKKQAQDIAWEAGRTYSRKEQYDDAYELADEALKIDPNNRKARYVKHRINKDIEERPTDVGGKNRTIAMPEGQVALKVALSDNMVTLQEAEDIAVKNSLMLESLRHRAAGARRKVGEAVRAFFPTAGLEFSHGGGVIADASYHSKRAMLNFSQPVYYGGELAFTLRQAQAGLRADELRYQKERTDILLQAGEAYRNAVNAVYNLNYQQELFKQISEFKTQQDKAFQSKLIAEIDQLEIASIYNQVSFQKETAVTTQKAANLTLCQAIGVRADMVLPVDPTVEVGRLQSADLEDYLNRVGTGNFDIRIRQATLESAYYGAKVFDAQRQPRVDLRGNWGWAGEAKVAKLPEDQDGAYAGPFHLDTEKEQSILATVAVPWGPNTTSYSYQRRFFAPTVSSFQGSEDFKHSLNTNFYDRLSNMTDEEIAKADYLKAMAELQKERTDQEINARQAYYDYESALLQLETSEAKIAFRERQVKILEQTTGMEEAKLTELLNEMVSLAEDRYSKITAVSSANNALAKMDYLAGMEGINSPYEIQSAQK